MRFLSAATSVLLFCTQVYSEPAQVAEPGFRIVVLQGEGSVNNIRSRAAEPPAVRVEDTSGKPISGAMVSFVLPTQGASGEFAGGGQSVTVPTDTQGKAAVRGLKPNNVSGKLEIRINATYRGETARAAITQYNMIVPGTSKGSGKTIAILAVLGAAAAAGGAVAATRGGAGNAVVATPARPSPISITPGTSTAGPPF